MNFRFTNIDIVYQCETPVIKKQYIQGEGNSRHCEHARSSQLLFQQTFEKSYVKISNRQKHNLNGFSFRDSHYNFRMIQALSQPHVTRHLQVIAYSRWDTSEVSREQSLSTRQDLCMWTTVLLKDVLSRLQWSQTYGEISSGVHRSSAIPRSDFHFVSL